MGNWAPTRAIVGLIDEFKVELLILFGAIVALVLIGFGIQYSQADGHEKAEIMRKIKGTIYIFVGIPALIWIASYAYERMRAIL